ncbi:MAG TPA: beta-ketoacyl synthase N-terminal-like domain-containing protein [Actinomycetota bacterium]|nr:beta-ketoacyl synthase N-terminal-like domain-containing protein [Actinomycetota bacterium]
MTRRDRVTDDIAIVGVGCRFPGDARDPDALWRLLRDGVDVVRDVPPDRWDERFFDDDGATPGKTYCRVGSFLDDVDRFDAEFFGISPREAQGMDPQQRILLEVAWEALDDAGLTRADLEESDTGVFMGILGMDYMLLHSKTSGVEGIDHYYASGKEFSFGTGRISYTLGLNGPCVMVNSACSSSLLATHLACQSLQTGESDVALAGGVNVILTPELSIFLSKVQAMSPTGRCKPFDARADGIVRGEGCAVVVLKRLRDALADGDRIFAVIRGSAVNHDGHSASLTVPNGRAQQRLLRRALAAAGVEPGRVAYVEAHGTGTPLGDPIEVGSLMTVFGDGRPEDRPLVVGSLKANFGHMDSAAGIAGLVKAALVLRHRAAPPQINFAEPNPNIPWDRAALVVPRALTPLAEDDRPAVAGVSAFGLSGTNVHVVLEAPPESAPAPADDGRPYALTVSADSDEGLRRAAARLRDLLCGDASPDLRDIAFTAAARRTHHDHRAALVGATRDELVSTLDSVAAGTPGPAVTGVVERRRPADVALVYSGQGSQWPGMGLDLYEREPAFRAALDRCDERFRALGGWSVIDEMRAHSGSRLRSTEVAQPAVFSIQVALTELLREWGVAPAAVVGHSMGEVAAAWASGALDLDEATHLIFHRARLMQEATGSGRMVAVQTDPDDARAAVDGVDGVCVGVVNGPRSVVLSGDAAALEDVVARLATQGIAATYLPVDYAFHSPAVRRHGDELERVLDGLTPRPCTVRMVSTVDDANGAPALDAAYWGRNVRDAVLLWPAIDRLVADGVEAFVELGAHPVLVRPILDAFRHRDASGIAVPTLARGADGLAGVLDALARLHVLGAAVDWRAVYRGRGRVVSLPRYPWRDDRYWLAGVRRGEQDRDVLVPGDLRAEVRLLDRDGRVVAELTGGGHAAAGTGAPTEPAPAADTPERRAAASAPAVPAAQTHAAPAETDASPAETHAAPADTGDAARERVAGLVQRVFAEVLGRDPSRRVPRTRGFFDLGMDSLTAVEFKRRLEDALACTLSSTVAFEHPTIDEMTDHLVSVAGTAAAADAARGDVPPDGTRAAGGDAAPGTTDAPVATDGTGVARAENTLRAESAARAESTADATASAGDRSAPDDEPIAIVGMACRFPGAPSIDDFWTLLRDGVDATSEIPSDRWDADAFAGDGAGTTATRRGAFLDSVDGFDASFFGVSPREARAMDPQQRLFMEVAFEALQDAGARLEELRGGRTGVFVGLNTNDYLQLLTRSPENIDIYYGTGNSFSGAAGRLSYFLGVRGPSIAVDTACSSSLTALHLACQSLRANESDVAVAGGVNVMVTPTVYLSMSDGGALAPDGRCKTFDESADGYARGEGAGAVVLKRLSKALADGDRVYALVRGSDVNQDGASGGLTVPSGRAQEEVVTRALTQAGVAPDDVDYVEAHGTGTSLGDPIELNALAASLCRARPADRPLLVGSVKTNIGHLEAAAGIAGVIKTVLALWHGEIPRHLNVTRPTSRFEWERVPLRVATESVPWRRGPRARVAGISAFGFTGTNAHVILSEAPEAAATRAGAPERFVVPVSAASRSALRDAAARLAARVEGATDEELADVCYTAAARRSHMEHRAVVVARSRAELVERLRAVARADVAPGVAEGRARPGERRPVAFVYSGSGSHWDRMGRELLAAEPAFRAAVEECDAHVRDVLGWSVLDVLESGRVGERARDALPHELVFAVQAGLTDLWRSWGIEPGAVAGHGMGEVAAAYASGALTLADATRVICHRTRVLSRALGTGSMVSVALAADDAAAAIAPYDGRVSVAVVDGPRSTVVSGDDDALRDLERRLRSDEVFCRRLDAPFPGHGPALAPLADELASALAGLAPRPATVPLYSSVTGDELDGTALGPQHWGRTLRDRVLFWDAVRALVRDGFDAFVEVSPHPVLLTAVEEGVRSLDVEDPVLVHSLTRGEPEIDTLLSSLASLAASGCEPDWTRLCGDDGRVVSLPPYPWQRKRYWLEERADGSGWDRGAGRDHPLLGDAFEPAAEPGTTYWDVTIDPARDAAARGAAIEDVDVVAPAALVDVVAAAARAALGDDRVRLDDVTLHRVVALGDEPVTLQARARVRAGRAAIEVHRCGPRGGELVASAAATRAPAGALAGLGADGERGGDAGDATRPASGTLAGRCGGELASTTEVTAGAGELVARVAVAESRRERYALHPALVDVCAALAAEVGGRDDAVVMTGARAVLVAAPAPEDVTVHVRTTDDGADATIFDDDGGVVARVEGIALEPAAGAVLDADVRARLSERLYRIAWEPAAERGEQDAAIARWVVCVDDRGVGDALCDELRAAGADVVALRRGDLDAGDAAAWERVATGEGAPDALVYLWGLGARAGDAAAARGALLAAGRALAGAGTGHAARLWVATAGAQDAGVDGCDAPEEAPLWGIARVLAMESPASWGGLVDLDPALVESDPRAVARALRAEITGAAGDDQLCLRGDDRVAARVAHAGIADPAAPPVALDGDATYVVTADDDAVAAPVVEWLAARGARRVVVAGPVAAVPDVDGAVVTRVAQDALAGALDDARRRGRIGGVVHVWAPAAVRPLSDTTARDVEADFERARVARRVHELTAGDDVDLFVLTCSAAPSWGSIGTAAGAAADAAIEALASERRAAGLPAQVVAWMPWDDDRRLPARDRALMVDSGLRPLTPADAIEALDYAVRTGAAATAVAIVDWATYRPTCENFLARNFLAGMGGDGASGAADDAPLRRELLETPAEQRFDVLVDRLLDDVADVLGLDDPSEVGPGQGFFELGMDSVMSLSLKTRLERALGCTLPATLTFEYPTTAALARHVLDEALEGVGGADDGVPADAAVADAGDGAADETAVAVDDRGVDAGDGGMDDVSDEELLARLDRELARSAALLGDD